MIKDVLLIVHYAGNLVTLYIMAKLHSVQGMSDIGLGAALENFPARKRKKKLVPRTLKK
jgi:hypothetical protein